MHFDLGAVFIDDDHDAIQNMIGFPPYNNHSFFPWQNHEVYFLVLPFCYFLQLHQTIVRAQY
jgi:hypothetical protein